MVDVGDDGEVADVGLIHGSYSLEGGIGETTSLAPPPRSLSPAPTGAAPFG
jgi:hypothetical protein